jgi:hypothetical protein
MKMNFECRISNAEQIVAATPASPRAVHVNFARRRRRRSYRILAIALAISLHAFTFPASAQLTREDVFRSIQTNVGGEQSGGSGKGFLLLLGAAAGLMIVMLIGSRMGRRQATPRGLDHPGKLLREVMKSVPLKANEMKQLKMLAEESRQGSSSDGVQSPLTFLLCPSVLGRTIKNHPAKIDRVVLTQIVRKMGSTPKR